MIAANEFGAAARHIAHNDDFAEEKRTACWLVEQIVERDSQRVKAGLTLVWQLLIAAGGGHAHSLICRLVSALRQEVIRRARAKLSLPRRETQARLWRGLYAWLCPAAETSPRHEVLQSRLLLTLHELTIQAFLAGDVDAQIGHCEQVLQVVERLPRTLRWMNETAEWHARLATLHRERLDHQGMQRHSQAYLELLKQCFELAPSAKSARRLHVGILEPISKFVRQARSSERSQGWGGVKRAAEAWP